MRNLLLSLLGLLAIASNAQPFQWTTYTSTSHVVETITIGSHIWAATTGGVFNYDAVQGTFDVYTNTGGLGMNQCTAIGQDSQGWLWVGLADGRITRLNPENGATKQMVDLQNEVFEINAILGVGDEVFVAANNGIYRFSYRAVVDNFRVLESAHVLGGFPGETAVRSLTLLDNFLYAATPAGLARASLQSESLSPPSAWENFTTTNSLLPENNLVAVYGHAGAVWIATVGSLVALTDGGFGSPFLIGGVRAFGSSQDELVCATPFVVYRYVESIPNWQPIGSSLAAINSTGFVDLGGTSVVYAGRGDAESHRGGISTYANGSDWSEAHSAGGLGGSIITALDIGRDGRVWAGTAIPNGSPAIYMYDNDWHHVLRNSGQEVFRFDSKNFAFDAQGGTWVSSFGDGVAWIRDDSVIVFNHREAEGFSTDGPRFAGIPDDANFVVTRVAANSHGDIYAVDRISRNFLPLLRVSANWISRGNNPDPWDYYSFGQTEDARHIESILTDPIDRIWVSTDGEGSLSTNWVYDDNGTPTNTGDDVTFNYIPAQRQDDAFTCFDDILPQALDWEVDQQGYLWVATPSGAYYTQGGIPQDLRSLFFICVADLPTGNRVNGIHVDSQDNKWFATDEGVAVLDKNFNWVHIFREATDPDYPSDLCSNNVTAITSDPATGEIWIGTADGLSRLKSPYVSRGNTLLDVWPYPNPFRADGSQRMFVDHQRLGGAFDELRIYTLSGRLVKKLLWAEMIDPARGWDGRNADGDLVTGGIYLLVAAAENGSAATGKAAVLGR